MAEGYALIANFMGNHDEVAIFRCFRELNTQDLLYLQAELIHLREELDDQKASDEKNDDRKYYPQDWWSLANSEQDVDKEQWSIVLKIRRKLEEYNTRIAQQVSLANLKEPNSYDLAFFRDWLQRPNMGNFPLVGLDRNAWAEDHTRDLFAVRRRQHDDPFSRWAINKLIPWFHIKVGSRFKQPIPESPQSEIAVYQEKSLLKTINIIGAFTASLLPILSIVVLYFLGNPKARLGAVVAFTAIFSISLILITQAKRSEIFAATSAFAAVQVVFVSVNYVVVGPRSP